MAQTKFLITGATGARAATQFASYSRKSKPCAYSRIALMIGQSYLLGKHAITQPRVTAG